MALPRFGLLHHNLTPRELEVLKRLTAGECQKTVSNRMGITIPTVKYHLRSIYLKLGVTNQLTAVIAGLRTGLVTLEES